MPVVLAVDGGQTGCRIALFDDAQLIGTGVGRGIRHRSGKTFARLVGDNVVQALDALGLRTGAVDAVCLGLSGFGGSPEVARELNDIIRRALDTARVLITNDAVTSYVGAIGFEAGVVVAAGTGAITLATDGRQNVARVDGWGYVLGDSGSGYEVGRRGLMSALRAFDGRGGSENLRRRAEQRFGPMDGLSHRIYGEPEMVAAIASFATDVSAAANEGDPAARSIWADAGRELALSAAAAARLALPREGPVTVSGAGRLFDAGELLMGPFRRSLEEQIGDARLVQPMGTPLDGARRICTTTALGAFGPLVHLFDVR